VVYVSSSHDCDCGSTSVTLSAQDGVDVIIDYRVLYVINPEKVVFLHRTWQHMYQDEFVIPMAKRIVEQVASKYPSNEIALIKRADIEKEIFQLLELEFSKSYLELFEFGIEDVRLAY
jgi:regulator of protease activity HflC (stomatin/prohibitin superfamily)